MKRRPLFALGICAAALLVWFVPGAAECWVYDRQSILSGEVWRLLTGHLVHFSPSHLVMDVATLALVGSLLELRTRVSRAALFLGIPCGISFVLLIFEPAMERYGGLSGLATAATVLLALHLCEGQPGACVGGRIALAGLLWKMACEWLSPLPLFVTLPTSTIANAPASHLAGAGLALLLFVLTKKIGRSARRQTGQESVSKQCPGQNCPGDRSLDYGDNFLIRMLRN